MESIVYLETLVYLIWNKTGTEMKHDGLQDAYEPDAALFMQSV